MTVRVFYDFCQILFLLPCFGLRADLKSICCEMTHITSFLYLAYISLRTYCMCSQVEGNLFAA
jgi:hypothetical protein